MPDGPVVLGVPWSPPGRLIRTGAALAATLGAHLVCAFVDPAGYLTEWEPPKSLIAASLDPALNFEAFYLAPDLLDRLSGVLGAPGKGWSFRVLNGDAACALARLAESTGASLIVVGGPRIGRLAALARLLKGSTSVSLDRLQPVPVVVVPRTGPPEPPGLCEFDQLTP
jgi:nucleotide-binding universal stress UspA family protein